MDELLETPEKERIEVIRIRQENRRYFQSGDKIPYPETPIEIAPDKR